MAQRLVREKEEWLEMSEKVRFVAMVTGLFLMFAALDMSVWKDVLFGVGLLLYVTSAI